MKIIQNAYPLRVFTLLLTLALMPLVGLNEINAASNASAGLTFNVTDTGCLSPRNTTQGGFLTMDPGVKPAVDGKTFTLQALFRGSNLGRDSGVVLIGQRGSKISPTTNSTDVPRALSIRIDSNTRNRWSIDLSGDSRLNFAMASTMSDNTWYQVTVVGDSNGIGMWIDGVRLTYSDGGGFITTSGTAPKFNNLISGESKAIGAWSTNTWCSDGFDLSNLRFTQTALFASNAPTVTLPATPYQNISGTTLLINSNSNLNANSTPFKDASSIQDLTNWGGTNANWVTATVDANEPVISNPAPTQSISAGSPVTCSINSSGGTILSYSVSPTPSNGLSFNQATGVLSGTPTVAAPAVTYTITGTNNSGSVSTSCTVTVNSAAPTGPDPAALAAAAQAAAQALVQAEAAKKQKELLDLLSIIPSLGSIALNLGETTKALTLQKCVKKKQVRFVKEGAKCPKGFVRER